MKAKTGYIYSALCFLPLVGTKRVLSTALEPIKELFYPSPISKYHISIVAVLDIFLAEITKFTNTCKRIGIIIKFRWIKLQKVDTCFCIKFWSLCTQFQMIQLFQGTFKPCSKQWLTLDDDMTFSFKWSFQNVLVIYVGRRKTTD